MTHRHIVGAYEDELNRLKEAILRLGNAAITQFTAAADALHDRNTEMAKRVVDGDAQVDAAQKAVEEACLSVLATRNPVADDLRLVLAANRLAVELERVGDLAKNIAKRTTALTGTARHAQEGDLGKLSSLAASILCDALAAFETKDGDLAWSTWQRDAELDQAHTVLVRDILHAMSQPPADVSAYVHLLFIAKNIERIGDHATNMAEVVGFMVTGRSFQAERPKADHSSEITS